MSPFRKKSELKRVAGGPVFIDLGSVSFPKDDNPFQILVLKPVDEAGLVQVKESVSGPNPIIVDMSGYVDDMAVAESSVEEVVSSAGRTVRKVGSDAWLIVSDDMVAENP